MKNHLFLILITGSMLIACSDNDSVEYPKLYTFTHVEEIEGETFIIGTNNTTSTIPTPGGWYGEVVDTLGQFIETEMRETVFFEEFELLSESTIRITALIDQVVWDTTIMYTIQDEQLVIENLDPEFINYNADSDEFEVCSYVRIGLVGPNASQNHSEYGILVGSCEFDFTGHLNDILAQEIFMPGDTLGLYILKMIYKN